MNKKKLAFYGGMAITLAFIAFAFLKMDFRQAIEVMKTVNVPLLLPVVILTVLNLYFRAYRWWYIIEPTKHIPVMHLFSAVSIGFMGNMIFPMRIGEFIRAYVIAKKESISTSGAFATIVLERLFDVVATLIMLFIAMMTADPKTIPPDTWQTLKTGGLTVTAIMLAVIPIFVVMAGDDSALSRGFVRLLHKLPETLSHKAVALFESFCNGLRVLKKGGHLFAIVAHSFSVWICSIASIYLFFPAFGLDPSWGMATMVLVFIIFGVAVPSSPGFVGPFHAGIVISLGLYGVDPDAALGMAIVIHLVAFCTNVGTGLFFLWREKMTMSEIQHSAD